MPPGSVRAFVESVMTGKLPDTQIRSYLLALREKGETADDLVEAAEAMRAHSVKLDVEGESLDTCGTGGDGSRTLNVSTLAAIGVAACGSRVAKHGNRSISGLCGSADLLESLGIPIDPGPEAVAKCLASTGFGFMFAPRFHPAMKHAAAARKGIEGRTIFNLLGPLTNPAGASRQLVGIFSTQMARIVCEALARLGARHAIVVSSLDGLDEVSLSDQTFVVEWKNRTLTETTVSPEQYGLNRAPIAELRCDTKESAIANAKLALAGLPGPALDFVALNTAFALRAAGIEDDIQKGVQKARDVFMSGAAKQKIEEIKKALGG